MAMSFLPDTSVEDEAIDINVIPLIDVLLVLLIFFMASASFVASGGIDVRLPQAGSESTIAQEAKLSVNVTADGRIVVDGRELSSSELVAKFRESVAQGPHPRLIVRADTKAEHGVVVRVLDDAKLAGIDDIAIAAILDRR